MDNLIIIAIVVVILAVAVRYIYKAKKSGARCIGCSAGEGGCSGSACGGCSCGCGGQSEGK